MFFLIAVIIGLIPAAIAQSKGKSFIAWWIYGTLIFIVALPHSLIMKADKAEIEKKQLAEGMKKCPSCAELVNGEANVCKHCGEAISGPIENIAQPATQSTGVSTIKPGKVECPLCKELIVDGAIRCKVCHGDLTDWMSERAESTKKAMEETVKALGEHLAAADLSSMTTQDLLEVVKHATDFPDRATEANQLLQSNFPQTREAYEAKKLFSI